jgi:hypothetical protein
MNNMPSQQQIAEAIERILRRGEFGGVAPDMPVDTIYPAERVLPRLADTLGGVGTAVMIALALAMLSCLIWLIFMERGRRLTGRPLGRPNGQTATADPLEQAEGLASQQDWSGALLMLYTLHLRMLHGQGWIVLHDSKTALQYQWELLGNGYDDIEGFSTFRKVFNRVRYGGYAELRETYETFLAYCRHRPERRRAA